MDEFFQGQRRPTIGDHGVGETGHVDLVVNQMAAGVGEGAYVCRFAGGAAERGCGKVAIALIPTPRDGRGQG